MPTSSSPGRRRARRRTHNALGETRRPPPRRPRRPDASPHTTHGDGGGRRRAARARRRRVPGPHAARHGTDRSGRNARRACGRPTSASSCRRSAGPPRRPTCCATGASRRCGPAPARCWTPTAAVQWRLLLAGLASPDRRPGSARPPALSWFFDISPDELVETSSGATGADGDSRLAALQRQLAMLADRMRQHGVGAFYEQLRAGPGCSTPCSARPNGDRNLTDLDHVADLLVAELGRPAGRAGRRSPTRSTADRRRRRPGRGHDAPHRDRRRRRADHHDPLGQGSRVPDRAPAVRLHRSDRPRTGRTCSTTSDGRVVDVASWVAWGDGVDEGSSRGAPGGRTRKRLADHRGRRRRAAAAVRRAHPRQAPPRGVVGADAASGQRRRSAGCCSTAGVRVRCSTRPPGDGFEKRRRRAHRSTRSTPSSRHPTARSPASTSPLDQPVRTPLPLQRTAGEPARRRRRRLAPSARRSGVADLVVHGDRRRPRHCRWRSRRRAGGRGLRRTAAARRGRRAAADGAAPADRFGGDAARRRRRRHHVRHGGPRGPRARRLHSPTLAGDDAPSSSPRRHAALGLRARRSRRSTAGLMAVIDTPLGPLFDGRRLARPRPRRSTRRADVRPHRSTPRRVRGGRHRRGADRHARPRRPAAPYGGQLASTLAVGRAGRVAHRLDRRRVPRRRAAQPRFVVVDYKTNRLHAAGRRRPAGRLPPRPARRGDDAQPLPAAGAAVLRRPAPLPALAARRALRPRAPSRRRRLPVRARHGRSRRRRLVDGEPYGVFSWRPPAATVLALDALFRSGRR